MEDHQTKPPLLYIEQHKEPLPEVNSQSTFYSANRDENENIKEVEDNSTSNSRFQSLTVDQRIEYLLDMPETLPKLKCKLMTKGGSFTGTIEGVEGDQINVRVNEIPHRRTINRDSLLDIQLIGF
ncbi:CotO family spore coat protein [Tenuibacillus multivorans]|uniref:Spore coat protein CotO n=1 Tax=Tenuibacillus multivorans TaxID=237069 RepID=A0A1H0EJ36_9BACI|nr:CotO family spore coat protein [Tenuibacillus multivorans]GEL77139.1 hypothetical protein TMU01_13740 [Tenuibacillus multivorans]SDN82296.1 Spore coat protein CotO [Tenuibacillus multivorans]